MKKILLTLAFMLIAVLTNAQTYKVDSAGKVVLVEKSKTTTVKKTDPVYQVVDSITFYKGAKGGIYYWRKSKETGKEYKCYVSSK